MKKSPRPLLKAICLSLAFAAPQLHARLGESKSTLEQRLLVDRRAVRVPEAVQERKLEASGYKNLLDALDLVEVSYSQAIYYKRAKDENIDRDDIQPFDTGRGPAFLPGWDLHVIYLGGKSVFEAYRRSSGLTEPERDGLLVRQSDGNRWLRTEDLTPEQATALEPEPGVEPLLRPQFLRSDGEVAALVQDNTLIFYSLDFEERLAKALHRERNERAPESLKGF